MQRAETKLMKLIKHVKSVWMGHAETLKSEINIGLCKEKEKCEKFPIPEHYDWNANYTAPKLAQILASSKFSNSIIFTGSSGQLF